MKIKVIAIGKLKKEYFQSASEDFVSRLKHYISLEIIECREEKTEKYLLPGNYNVILDRTGTQMSSIEFANFISEFLVKGSRDLAFFVGDANGFAKKFIEKGDLQLSFSKMTFPHEMSRIILLEQIYRAFTIIQNEKYHK